ncbi:MAG: PAS domain-containing sensor histidine kinase [Campylobacterota bacterium]|nr:PAS domain-containing sensor histidine kinase [Campylobacterota bacterium]
MKKLNLYKSQVDIEDDLNCKDKIVQSVDIDGNILNVSPKWCEVLGYQKSEVIGKSFKDFIHVESLFQIEINFKHLKDYGFTVNVPLKILTKNGKVIEVRLNGRGFYDNKGGFTHTICEIRSLDYYMSSIIETTKLLDKEKLLNTIGNVRLSITSLYHKDIAIDEYFENIKEILKEPTEVVDVTYNQQEKLYETYLSISKEHSSNSKDNFITLLSKKGNSYQPDENSHLIYFIIDDPNSPFYNKKTVFKMEVYVVGSIWDEWKEQFDLIIDNIEAGAKYFYTKMTMKKQQEMLIQQSKVASIGELLGNIAHQWRQPLSAITSSAANIKIKLLMDNLKKDELEENLDNISEFAEHLSQTIDDFKTFFSSDTSFKEKFSLDDAISKVRKITKDSFLNMDIKYIENIEEITIYENENLLIQALINIFNNAKDAMAHVDIKNRFLFVDIKKVDDKVQISIKDSGGGVPENIIHNIFDPYFTTRSKTDGTGIGLYMTNQIITKHLNGTINVNNVKYSYNPKS